MQRGHVPARPDATPRRPDRRRRTDGRRQRGHGSKPAAGRGAGGAASTRSAPRSAIHGPNSGWSEHAEEPAPAEPGRLGEVHERERRRRLVETAGGAPAGAPAARRSAARASPRPCVVKSSSGCVAVGVLGMAAQVVAIRRPECAAAVADHDDRASRHRRAREPMARRDERVVGGGRRDADQVQPERRERAGQLGDEHARLSARARSLRRRLRGARAAA